MKIISFIAASLMFLPLCSNTVFSLTERTVINGEAGQQKIYDQTFVFRNDNITQTLMCNWPKDGKVEFKYINNPVGGKESVISGVATYVPSEETGVDDDGNAYLIEEYEFMNGCNIVLRLDADENKRATVRVRNCPKGNANNAFESAGIMQAQR